jgi:lysophospholipid hydrolase
MHLDPMNPRSSPLDARSRGIVKQQARIPSRLRNSFSSDNTVMDQAAALNMPPRPEVTFPKQNGELSFEQALVTDDDNEEHIPDWRDTANAGSKRARLSSDASEAHERTASTGPSQATVARAKVDSTLAVLPAEAFKRLTHKFPKASAHIVQGKSSQASVRTGS